MRNYLIKKIIIRSKCQNQSKNIFEYTKKLSEDVFVARAFKPLEIILELIHNQAANWKKFFVFLGKASKVPLIAKGTIGDPDLSAMIATPSLA